MKENYFTDDGKPVLKYSICAFIDVLGFSDQIKESYNDHGADNLLDRYYKIIREEIEYQNKLQRFCGTWEMKIFSDNILFSFPILSDDGEDEFVDAMSQISHYQLSMALNGFFVRGGISLGDLFIDDHTIYGKALLDAYELESKIANVPRIVISNEMLVLINKLVETYSSQQGSPFNRDILRDRDGFPFINYLDNLLYLDCNGADALHWEKISIHKNNIEVCLNKYSADPKVWSKYFWVANYHDYFCQQYQYITGFLNEHYIDKNLAKTYPSKLFG